MITAFNFNNANEYKLKVSVFGGSLLVFNNLSIWTAVAFYTLLQAPILKFSFRAASGTVY